MAPPFVLVLLASMTGAAQCLRVAEVIGQRLGQKLRIAHIEIGPGSILLPSQEELSEYEAEHLADRERAETEKLRELVADWTRQTGLSVEFDLFQGDEWRVMRHYRGIASMVVLAAPYTQPIGHRETLRAALLRTGHAVVMVPPSRDGSFANGSFGRRLLVGWEDVPPLRRAIAAFTPFLAAAERVDVVAVEQDASVLETARAVIAPITATAEYRAVAAAGRRTATALLEEAAACQADGLVMGAFRRGEILNWLVPGTSTRLIQQSFVPLLMSP
jgi:nucleotide-binding universal stress UspA family protein